MTTEQQQRFMSFRSVAATVIRDDNDDRIGVLSAISHVDDGFFQDDVGLKILRDLAQNVAHLIHDASRWMLPDQSEEDAVRGVVVPSADPLRPVGQLDLAKSSYRSYGVPDGEREARADARREQAARSTEVAAALETWQHSQLPAATPARRRRRRSADRSVG